MSAASAIAAGYSFFVHVRMIAVCEQRAGRVSEVDDRIFVAQHLLQLGGVRVVGDIFDDRPGP